MMRLESFEKEDIILFFTCLRRRNGQIPEVEACYVAQASLELLTSSDLPASVSQSTGITSGMHSNTPSGCLKPRILQSLIYIYI
ncbi:protein GVQW3-like [Pongo pygmaeus]|uniref:protein GVQW3-like n=1 Tax=Pongo pygmaeus TaxID=9600 RepID=UPI00300C9DB5